MQAKVNQTFLEASSAEHPFVKELYKTARAAAKKYDDTVRAQEKQAQGIEITAQQKQKIA